MHTLLYILLIAVVGVGLFMLYNRLYFEIHLAHGLRKLRKAMQESMEEQVDEFTENLKDVLNLVLDGFIDSYKELIDDIEKENK